MPGGRKRPLELKEKRLVSKVKRRRWMSLDLKMMEGKLKPVEDNLKLPEEN